MIKPEDYTRPPCPCVDCRQAGVSAREQIRDRVTGQFLHGYDLKRWYEARESFWKRFHEQVGRKAMR